MWSFSGRHLAQRTEEYLLHTTYTKIDKMLIVFFFFVKSVCYTLRKYIFLERDGVYHQYSHDYSK